MAIIDEMARIDGMANWVNCFMRMTQRRHELSQRFSHPLIDMDRLLQWMDGEGLGKGALMDPLLLSGGNQNILLKFQRGDRWFILRRPPLFPRMDGSETMRREARILSALTGSAVPHAPLIAACPDADVLGAAFYLMEPVDGFNAPQGLPPAHARDPALRHAMGLALVSGLLALGRVGIDQPALAGFRRPEGFLERQAPRWQRQLQAYRDYAGWPGPAALGDIDRVGGWLADRLPPSFAPGLMHGDYHIGNVMYRHEAPDIAAIVDWELGTIGDPLLDIANLIATWPAEDGGRTITVTVEPWHGFPTIGELVARYREGSHRDATHLRWYAVLACYRLGILLEGTHARSCSNKAPAETGGRAHGSAVRLLDRARRWMDEWPYD